jgi:DNA helicase-2/ATP-dependent DNA helicase PcrA
MKILLAGPGTGKTYKIREIIKDHGDGSRFLVLSFTNATINDLCNDLESFGVDETNCMTLHKFSLKFNHDQNRHILSRSEEKIIRHISGAIKLDFDDLCNFLSCTTFDQMIIRFVEYAKSNPTYLKNALSDYEVLIVDEYQDFNTAEQALIDVLLNMVEQSYILGDDDQCIYDFKDASNEKIISLFNDELNEKVPHTHMCHRCPDEVVKHAKNLIEHNKNRVAKEWLESNKPGRIYYQQFNNLSENAAGLVNTITNTQSNETTLVLSPVEFLIHPIVAELEKRSIAFDNYFSTGIPIETEQLAWEVKSLFGSYRYLNTVLIGYKILAFRRKLYMLISEQFKRGIDYSELLNLVQTKLPSELKTQYDSLSDMLNGPRFIPILELFNKSTGINDEERLKNMLREVNKKENTNIKIMSIHKSKGLSADNVFILGTTQGILPNAKKGNDSLESQRRLFYVGMTRAKKRLFLYSVIEFEGRYVNKVSKKDFKYNSSKKKWYGKASQFIAELKLTYHP